MFASLTPVVKNLIIINVLAFLGTMAWEPNAAVGSQGGIEGFMALGRLALAAFPPTSPFFYPVQVVTNIFMHGDFWHLLFNMIGLAIFGTMVERAMGPKRFFGFYMGSGFAGLLIYWLGAVGFGVPLASIPPVLGASGAVYAVLLSAAYISPNTKIQLLIPPIPVKIGYLAIGLFAYNVYQGWTGTGGSTANFAHIGGALFGVLLTVWWVKRGVIRA